MDSNGISGPPAAHEFIVGPQVFIKQIGRLRGVRPVFRFYPGATGFRLRRMGKLRHNTLHRIIRAALLALHWLGVRQRRMDWWSFQPVQPTPEDDKRELELSYQTPTRLDHKKLFLATNLEIQKPSQTDIVGFVISVGICCAFLALATWLADIGS